MRLEDLLNQTYATKRLTSYQKVPESAAFGTVQKQAQDRVSISSEAKAAQQEQLRQGGGYFTNSAQEPSELMLTFKAYMDKVTGRVPSMPKTPEEKIKELTEKIKKLQTQLSEVMADESLSGSVKSNRIITLNAQINEAYARLTELGKEMGGSGSDETAEA